MRHRQGFSIPTLPRPPKKKTFSAGFNFFFSNPIFYNPSAVPASSLLPSIIFPSASHSLQTFELYCIVLVQSYSHSHYLYYFLSHSIQTSIMGKVKESKGSKATKADVKSSLKNGVSKVAPKAKEVSKKATPSKKSKKEETSDSSESESDSDDSDSDSSDADSDSESDKKPTKVAPKTNGKVNGVKKDETSDSSESSDDDEDDSSDDEEKAKPAAAKKEASVSQLSSFSVSTKLISIVQSDSDDSDDSESEEEEKAKPVAKKTEKKEATVSSFSNQIFSDSHGRLIVQYIVRLR